MSRILTTYWPSANSVATILSPSTQYTQAGPLQVTSNEYFSATNIPVNNSGEYTVKEGYRNVIFTTSAPPGAVLSITITGWSQSPVGIDYDELNSPALQSETITIPNLATTVSSVNLYNKINPSGIVLNSAGSGAAGIAIGLGGLGHTPYFNLDTSSGSPQHYSVGCIPVNATADFEYQAFSSMWMPNLLDNYYDRLAPQPIAIPALQMFAVAHNTPTYANSLGGGENNAFSPAAMTWCSIDDTGGDGNAQFYFTLIQQGIK